MPSQQVSSPEAPDSYRRFFIAAGGVQYDHLPPAAQLHSVTTDIARMTTLFCRDLGYEQVLSELGDSPMSSVLRGRLSTWLRHPDRSPNDVVVVYFSGHGATEAQEHYLLTRDSLEHNLVGTALATRDIGKMLGGNCRVQHLLLIIDTCQSGQGVHDMLAVAGNIVASKPVEEQLGTGLWLLAAARPRDEAAQGRFSHAFMTAVRSAVAGNRQPYLQPLDLVGQINGELARANAFQRARCGAVDASAPAPFLPNPRYQADLPQAIDVAVQQRLLGAGARGDLREHWGPRSRGVELDVSPGWYFTGRHKVLSELVNWLQADRPEYLITAVIGGPGSGKSAVLARLVTTSDPGYRLSAVQHEHVDDWSLPPPLIDFAIHARNKSTEDIKSLIGAAIGIDASSLDDLTKTLKSRPDRLVIAVDAVDEAIDPWPLINFLRALSNKASPRLRLLIGTRQPYATALGEDCKIINLDDPGYISVEDIAQYATRILVAQDEPTVRTPYRSDPQRAARIGNVVAANAYPTFLVARIMAHSLMAAGTVIDEADDDWKARLPNKVGPAFDAYLARFGKDEARVRDLLRPIAWAEGAGLPWAELWAPLAEALSGLAYSDGDIEWLLEAAGPYLIESLEYGRSVYRLYHAAMAEHLRQMDSEKVAHSRFFDILSALTPTAPDGNPDWFAAHPYIRSQLAIHAARAGRLGELLGDSKFLIATNYSRLTDAVGLHAQNTREAHLLGRAIGPLYRYDEGSPVSEEQISYLQLRAREYGVDSLAEDIERRRLRRPWAALWAHLFEKWDPWKGREPHGCPIGNNFSSVIFTYRRRRTLVTGGGLPGAILWDLESGAPLGRLGGDSRWLKNSRYLKPLGHLGWSYFPHNEMLDRDYWHVRCTAAGMINGRPVVVAGGDDGSVRLWHLTPRSQCRIDGLCGQHSEQTPIVHAEARRYYSDDWSTGVSLVVIDGTPCVVCTNLGGDIRVLNAMTGKLTIGPLEYPGMLWRSITVNAGDHVFLACGGGRLDGARQDGEVRLWDVHTGKPVGEPLRHDDHARGLAVAYSNGIAKLLTLDMSGTIRIWALPSLQMLDEVERINPNIWGAVAIGMRGGREIVLTGDSRRSDFGIDVMDLRSRQILYSINIGSEILDLQLTPEGVVVVGCMRGMVGLRLLRAEQ